MRKTLISLSGGMDSAVLLADSVPAFDGNLEGVSEVAAVRFYYGSRHGKMEYKAASLLAKFYGVKLYNFNLKGIFDKFHSHLLKGPLPLPLGHYSDENMKLTVVPGRNTIFASILLGLAQSQGYNQIALANHAGDANTYPDCRPGWFHAMDDVTAIASEGSVEMLSPFLYLEKYEIVSIGHKLQVPFELTYSCYSGQPEPCWQCGSCTSRIEAFERAGVEDPAYKKKNNHILRKGGANGNTQPA